MSQRATWPCACLFEMPTLLAAWRPPKKLRSRPAAYDVVVPDLGFDGVPFDDEDEELTPGADEDIQSPLPLQDPVALQDDAASYIRQIAGYEDVGRRRTSESHGC